MTTVIRLLFHDHNSVRSCNRLLLLPQIAQQLQASALITRARHGCSTCDISAGGKAGLLTCFSTRRRIPSAYTLHFTRRLNHSPERPRLAAWLSFRTPTGHRYNLLRRVAQLNPLPPADAHPHPPPPDPRPPLSRLLFLLFLRK